MLNKIKAIAKKSFPKLYKKAFDLKLHVKTDYFFISFPKCGRTWLRLMLGKYLVETYNLSLKKKEDMLEVSPLSNYNKNISSIKFTHDDDPHLKRNSNLSTNKLFYKFNKVVFLSRDPRDVIVSLYHQLSKRRKNLKYKEINDFVLDEEIGIKRIINFYNIWQKNKEKPKDFLLVRYEDLQDDTVTELTKIIKFLDLGDVNITKVKEAVEYAKFENMRKMEEKEEFDSNRLQPSSKNDLNSYKTRKGKVGGYKEELNKETINKINLLMNELLNKEFFNYS